MIWSNTTLVLHLVLNLLIAESLDFFFGYSDQNSSNDFFQSNSGASATGSFDTVTELDTVTDTVISFDTLSELSAKGFVRVCEGTETVFLPKHLDLHPLQNSNQAKGAAKLYKEVNNNFKYINELAKVLLSCDYMDIEPLEGFRKGLERVSNDITVSVTVSNSVTVSKEPVADAPEFDWKKSFDEFWSEYPKKKSKDSAMSKFKTKCKTKVVFDQIMTGLRRQMPHWTDPQYIPYPAKWLNGGAWEDEIETDPGGRSKFESMSDMDMIQILTEKGVKDARLMNHSTLIYRMQEIQP